MMIQNRQSERFDVSLYVRIRTAKEDVSGKIVNISKHGLGINTTYPSFKSGETITVGLENGKILKGKVAWMSMGKLGIELHTPMKDSEFEEIIKG